MTLVVPRKRFQLRSTHLACSWLVAVAVTAVLGPALTGDPQAFDASSRLGAPSAAHVFGTDNLGRDLFTLLVHGARSSLIVGVLTCAIAVSIGILVGLLSAMFSAVDAVVMRVVDGIQSFPMIVLALAMTAVLGASTSTIVLALTIVLTPGVCRVVRSRALVVVQSPMLESARAVGASSSRILVRYVLPACVTQILVQAAQIFSTAILIESALSFIGAGLPPTTPSWGGALADSRSYLQQAWWMWAFPALALIATVFAVNLILDDLRQRFFAGNSMKGGR